MTKLICNETGRKTGITLTDEPWTDDEIVSAAADRIIKREKEHRYDFVCIGVDNMKSEIFHACGGLTEHTGVYRSFKIIGN